MKRKKKLRRSSTKRTEAKREQNRIYFWKLVATARQRGLSMAQIEEAAGFKPNEGNTLRKYLGKKRGRSPTRKRLQELASALYSEEYSVLDLYSKDRKRDWLEKIVIWLASLDIEDEIMGIQKRVRKARQIAERNKLPIAALMRLVKELQELTEYARPTDSDFESSREGMGYSFTKNLPP